MFVYFQWMSVFFILNRKIFLRLIFLVIVLQESCRLFEVFIYCSCFALKSLWFFIKNLLCLKLKPCWNLSFVQSRFFSVNSVFFYPRRNWLKMALVLQGLFSFIVHFLCAILLFYAKHLFSSFFYFYKAPFLSLIFLGIFFISVAYRAFIFT